MLKVIFKIIGVLFLLLILLVGVVLLKNYFYPKYELKLDPAEVGNITTQAEIDQLAKELVAQMSLDEKLAQMSARSGGLVKLGVNALLFKRFPHVYSGRNKRLNIPPFCFSDGPRGVVVGDGPVTCFPVAMARAASWDVELESKVADVIGKELRGIGANYT